MPRGQPRRQAAVLNLGPRAGTGIEPAAARDENHLGLAVKAGRRGDGQAVRGANGTRVHGGAHDTHREAGRGEDLERSDRVEVVKAIKQDDVGEGERRGHARIVASRPINRKWPTVYRRRFREPQAL